MDYISTSWSYYIIPRHKRQFSPAFFSMYPNTIRNPFVDDMFTPRNFDVGVGLDLSSKPFMMGGNLNYPTGNLMKPMESIGGTFAYAQPFALKYGTQLGPYYPWQIDGFEKAIAAANSVDKPNAGRQWCREPLEELLLWANQRLRISTYFCD
uniref:Uncharacterized protein n=1 Tax=Romanomermis culicivorax TaxID=13658 RepID=A0A915L6N9_ROMCU